MIIFSLVLRGVDFESIRLMEGTKLVVQNFNCVILSFMKYKQLI